MGRRDQNDELWKQVRELVFQRDEHKDRLLKVLSAKEALLLKEKGSFLVNSLDPCHILPVGMYPELVYETSNIVVINRASHGWLDSFKHPVTGRPITKEDVMDWWQKIAGPSQWRLLQKAKERVYGREG